MKSVSARNVTRIKRTPGRLSRACTKEQITIVRKLLNKGVMAEELTSDDCLFYQLLIGEPGAA